MNRNIPKHFSNNFRLNIDKLPSKESDRLNLYILLPGLFLGAALFCLGLFEFINGSNNSQPLFDKLMLDAGAEYDSFVSPWFFDAVLMLLGAGIVISLFLSHLRYKKIYFDGKSVTMIQRPAIGKKKTFRELFRRHAADGALPARFRRGEAHDFQRSHARTAYLVITSFAKAKLHRAVVDDGPVRQHAGTFAAKVAPLHFANPFGWVLCHFHADATISSSVS